MKNQMPFETKAHSMTGRGSVDFYSKENLNSFAMKLIPNYNPDRFDAMGLRIYIKNENPIITIYAVDTFKQDQNNYPKDKLPVKKFKLNMSMNAFIKNLKSFDMTLTNGSYELKDMMVMNK